MLQEQYPVALFTSLYLPRPPAIGFIYLLAPEVHLPQATQSDDLLDRIDSRGQVDDDQVYRGGSETGHYSP